MQTMTTGVNASLTLAETLFQDLVWNPLLQAGLTALKAQVPAFAVWPLSMLTDKTAQALADYLYNQIRLLVDVTAIRLINDAHQNAYESASIKLMVLAHDKGIDSPEFTQAREDAKKALSAFAHFNQ